MAAEPIVQLAQKYRGEFEQTFNQVRQRTMHAADEAKQKLNEVQATAMHKKDEVMPVLLDMGPVESMQGERVLETYAWSAVMLFTYALCTAVCGMFVGPIFESMGLTTMAALCLSYGALPYVAYRHVITTSDDEAGRFQLLAFAAAEGFLCGFVLSDRALSTGGPLIFVTPLCIGIVAQLCKGMLVSRQQLLAACVGAGLLANLVLGLVSGQLSFAYFVLACLYAGAGFASMQLYIKYGKDSQQSAAHVHQLGMFCLSIVAQLIIYALMGASYDSYKEKHSGVLPSLPNPLGGS